MKNLSRSKTILLVSIISATTNGLLSIFKIIIGKFGHSQALIADGVHSFSDLVSDGFVYVAARVSGREPDSAHPYGHQRIETIATIIIALMLLVIGASICYEGVSNLILHAHKKAPTYLVVVVAICSIIANEGLFHFSRTQGRRIKSNLLISNAWHNRTDAFVSILVLLSVIGSLSGLLWLDGVGAIIIALLIIKMGGKMIWDATNELIDTGVDQNMLMKIENTIQNVPGVKSLHQLRTRLHGGDIFIDCHIIVSPFISVSEGHYIGEQVHLALMNNIDNVTDVTMHIDPEDDEKNHPSLTLPSRQAIKTLLKDHCGNLPGYNNIVSITLHYLAGKLVVELYMAADVIRSQDLKSLEKTYQDVLKPVSSIETIKIYLTHE